MAPLKISHVLVPLGGTATVLRNSMIYVAALPYGKVVEDSERTTL